jgi:LL-diaminopimelate aminotransferase
LAQANSNYQNLQDSYLFTKIARKVAEFKAQYPDKTIISLGIGDVTLPLVPAVIQAMHGAVEDMAHEETFKGYGPEQGYAFLKEAVAEYDFRRRGVDIATDEIFISDGAKSDMGNIGDIFSSHNQVLISDPVYPVYLDTNIMAGRKVSFVAGTEENGFLPSPPGFAADVIYICSPNNPTGSVMSRSALAAWVEYAARCGAVILFDAAYEAYISDPEIPHSIYEIPGAKKVAIEFRSFSKTAGFTGLRCGFCVVPRELTLIGAKGEELSAHALWNRRHTTKFNGTPYVVQKAAAAIYTPEGRGQIQESIDYYMENGRLIREGLQQMGVTCIGGVNAPYIWMRCPGGMDSWGFFDALLRQAQVVGTPGVGFGPCGEGWFRLTAFNSRGNTLEALRRIRESGIL